MRALVTGAAAGGIGGAICVRLARDALSQGAPARIVACATGTNPASAALAAELRSMGAEVLALSGDLADPVAPARLVAEAQQFCGGLDALVSNAGIAIPALLTELPLEGWDRIISVHTRAAWLLAKAAYPALREARGAMVAIGSINGSFPHVGHGAYAAAKAALTSLCQTLAMEWASDGIRVNVVSPGLIRTQMNVAVYRDPVLAAERDAMIPLGRSGSVDDVAGVVAFLLGSDARFITGENIFVDGGFARSSLNRMARRAGNAFVSTPIS